MCEEQVLGCRRGSRESELSTSDRSDESPRGRSLSRRGNGNSDVETPVSTVVELLSVHSRALVSCWMGAWLAVADVLLGSAVQSRLVGRVDLGELVVCLTRSETVPADCRGQAWDVKIWAVNRMPDGQRSRTGRTRLGVVACSVAS